MRCVAFITAKGHHHLSPEDLEVAQKLRDSHGVRVVIVPWGSNLPKVCDVILFRSCHDYSKHLQLFELWLEELSCRDLTVLNSLELVRLNIDKNYLLQFQEAGIAIVPTIRCEAGSEVSLSTLMSEKGWNSVVIKPAVSVGAIDTFRIDQSIAACESKIFNDLLSGRAMLVQQFIPGIETSGEISLVYFGGEYSHSVLKTPAVGDFRIQKRFGGKCQKFMPPSMAVEAAAGILKLLPSVPTYARVDGVFEGEEFLLMELELIEPQLYLSVCSDAVDRFVNAIITHF